MQMATIDVSELVLSICPKHVFSELPAFSSTSDGDTARRNLGSGAISLAFVSKSLEIAAQISVGKVQHLL